MNIQREAIYKKRYNALSGERLSVDLFNMYSSLAENIVERNKEHGTHADFRNDAIMSLGVDPSVDEAFFEQANEQQIVKSFQEQIIEQYERKSEKIQEVLLPVIQNVHKNEGHRYKRIAIPYTDGSDKPLNISAELEDAINTEGGSIMKDIEKAVSLSIIDQNWKEHLRSMDELKDSVQSASFEQKDPLVIYKMEAYNLFENLVYNINVDIASYLLKGKLMIGNPEDVQEAKVQKTNLKDVRTNKDYATQKAAAARAGQPSRPRVETYKRVEKKVKRNDPCPCGSGKKYKQCHGK